MLRIYILTMILLSLSLSGWAQHTVEGYVYELQEMQHGDERDTHEMPLVGANIWWQGTAIGTATDGDGYFDLEHPSDTLHMLVFSYIGYVNDTVHVEHDRSEPIKVVLSQSQELEGVTVEENKETSSVLSFSKMHTVQIDNEEFEKAACCNLSESFETNADVDVGQSDAVTGAREIKLLGLDGVYTQIMFENIPALRGLATTYGLNYVPGPWMESISINKGTGSVVNGYEAITGQIDLQYKKPFGEERLHLNLFGNHLGRFESNINLAHQLNDKVSTQLLFHTNQFNREVDNNDDGFLDLPKLNEYNLMHRWRFSFKQNWVSQVGVFGLYEERVAGQADYNEGESFTTQDAYGVDLVTKRLGGYTKLGHVFDKAAQRSLGWMTRSTHHYMKGNYGKSVYEGTQTTVYTNLIFQSYIKSPVHTLKGGFSFLYDDYDETFGTIDLERTEKVPGVFVEHTFDLKNKVSVVSGLRLDHHNLFGVFFSPKMHFRYNPMELTTIRLSAGRGYHVVNIFAENTNVLVSSREIILQDNLREEVAWNFGANFTQKFEVLKRNATFSIDYYHTLFENQVIVDLDQSTDQAIFYNLNGMSYSNSLQVELRYELAKGLDMKAAFKFNDVKQTINGTLRAKPMVPRYLGHFNIAYETPNKGWKFDFTAHLNGKARLPNTQSNPELYQLREYSPVYPMLFAQITKSWEKFDIYVGGENLTNYTQSEPILAADDPFGPYFDASMAWGPIVGARVYAGIRLSLN